MYIYYLSPQKISSFKRSDIVSKPRIPAHHVDWCV